MSSSIITSIVEIRIDGEVHDITPFIDQFTWTESMLAGGFSWSLRFRTGGWKAWDSIMMGQDNPEFSFRVSSQEGEERTLSSEWRTGITDKSRAAFNASTRMLAEIKGADQRLVLAQKARTRAWNNMRASDVLQSIATEYGLSSDIAASAYSSVWVQARQDDWSFMRDLALTSTVSGNRGDSYLWLDGSTLRYQAPTLTDMTERRYDVSVLEDRVEDFAFLYSGREVDRNGGATLRGIGFDFDTKRGLVFDMDPVAAATQPALAPRVPRRMGDGLRVVPFAEDDLGVVSESTRSRWGRVAPRYLSVRLRARPDPSLRPNKVISIENSFGDLQQTPFMGRYVLLEVQHIVVGSLLTTSITGFRRESQVGDAQPTDALATNTGTRDENQTAGSEGSSIRTAKVLS